MPDPDHQVAVLITHIVFQTKIYVQFLVQQNRIPRETANELFSKLDSPLSSVTGLTHTDEGRGPTRTGNVRRSAIAPPKYEAVMKHESLSPAASGPSPVSPPSTSALEMPQRSAQLSTHPIAKARALWDWHEKGQVSLFKLSFLLVFMLFVQNIRSHSTSTRETS